MASTSGSRMSGRPSSTKSRPSTSKAPASNKPSFATTKPVKEFQLPAFSIPYVPKVTESELEKLKKRTIRRNAPPGEDLQAIKTILRNIRGQNITVQEFISLMAPSTGDKGEAMRQVMNDDLVAFRKLSRKVYDTITMDNSDVLLNQQMQLVDYYKEKKNLLNTKMMNMIEEIFMMAPKFDFDRYGAEGQKYLDELIPIPEELKIEPEELEMMRRQAAYHRLQWLRSEGERLSEENSSLKKRLNQLRKLHMQEQKAMDEMEHKAEAKKEALEVEEAKKQQTLDMLNRSLEKTIIEREKALRESQDLGILEPTPSTGAIRKKPSKTKVKRRKPKWNEQAAAEIEDRTLAAGKQSEMSKVDQRDPFHFSPIKTPPRRQAPAKAYSPFHYSPPKSPEGAAYISPPLPPTRVRSPSAPVSQQQVTRGRRAQGPRDTWGGFY